MPKTIDEGFATYLGRLTPSDFETQQAKSHRASIEATLKAKFGMTSFFRSGSFGFGTSVSSHSDVDYFAVVPNTALKSNSDISLSEFRTALDQRFPQTGVRIESPAIVLPFGSTDGERHEVVPAYFLEAKSNYRVFAIPNRSGGWMRSSPEAHAAYVNYADKKLNGKVKPLIRLIKSWKYYNGGPVRSFYLEVAVAQYALTQNTILHDFDVLLALRHLQSLQLQDIVDPMGTSAGIQAGTAAERASAWLKLQKAVDHAQSARDATSSGNIAQAFASWDKVFGGNFPGYY